MTKYVLTVGEKEDSRTVNLNDYIVGELFTIKPEAGYFTRNDLVDRFLYTKYSLPFDKLDTNPKKIIIKNSFAIRNAMPTQAKEFLTGTKIDLLYIGQDKFKSIDVARMTRKEMDTFVSIDQRLSHPTVQELWDYIQEHEDRDKYRYELEQMMHNGRKNHQLKKDKEKEEIEKKKAEKVLIKIER